MIENIKSETGEILEFLKNRGYSRSRIAEDLGYAGEKSINEAYSRSKSTDLLVRLRLYKDYILLKTIWNGVSGTNLDHLVPGPEASLEQLLIARKGLQSAVQAIDERIDSLLGSKSDNSAIVALETRTEKGNAPKRGK